jgi:hypothetical protein
MRSGGLPCRSTGCREVFLVAPGASLEDLVAASSRRSVHEVAEHDYHHERLGEHTKLRVLSSIKRPQPS